MFIGGCGELGFAGVQIDRAEVQPIAAFGVQCRLNGTIAGIADRRRWQAGDLVRVVRVGLVLGHLGGHLRGLDVIAIGHGGIHAQRHALLQTVLDDSRHFAVVIGFVDLGLGDRGDDHHPFAVTAGRHAQFIQLGDTLIDHGLEDFRSALHALDVVGSRLQPSLKATARFIGQNILTLVLDNRVEFALGNAGKLRGVGEHIGGTFTGMNLKEARRLVGVGENGDHIGCGHMLLQCERSRIECRAIGVDHAGERGSGLDDFGLEQIIGDLRSALALAHGEFDLAIARSRIVRDGRRLVAPAVAPCDELGYAEIAAADKQGDDGDSDDNATDTLALAMCTSLAHLLAGFRRFWRRGPAHWF